MKNKITVAVVVYNEAHRIENYIKSMLWCDDIIIVDKSSTDSTKEVAAKYPVTVLDAPYSDTGDELKFAKDIAKHDWILCTTASSAIDLSLVLELNLLLSNDIEYDVVNLPYSMHVFGICSKYSPWFRDYKPALIRKSALVTSTEVHKEISFNSTKVLNFTSSSKGAFYHLTHPNIDSFLERHIRYTKCECLKYDKKDIALKQSLWEIIRAFANIMIKKRVWLLGWDGIALGIAYLSYSMLKFLFIWEKFRSNESRYKYDDILSKIISDIEHKGE